MLVLGLTGGIASGKSVIAERFRAHAIAVFDADAQIHDLLQGEAKHEVLQAFPEAMEQGEINRARLGSIVFSQPEKLHQLESILHPKIRAREIAFIEAQRAAAAKLCVLEVPLLFETGADILCDATIVASAPEAIRSARALTRTHMTEAKLKYVLQRQLPEDVRARRANYIITTTGSLEDTHAQVDNVLGSLL